MATRDKDGTLIKSLRQSRQGLTINHGISRILEELQKCKSGVPTQDGSNYSPMRVNSSQTFKITESLMFTKERMKSIKKLLFTPDKEELIRDGRSNM